MKMLYFDHNATTPLLPDAHQVMEHFLTGDFANPSAIYQAGRAPARAIREARRRVAELLEGADESEIFFTSGGTESNNTALRSALAGSADRKEVVISAVEHSSIKKLAAVLEKEGIIVRQIPVDRQGNIARQQIRNLVSEKTAIVSLMLANNETGVLFPIDEIAPLVKQAGALFHVDAVQAAGKIPLSVQSGLIDFLSLSAHKFYGPKGIGALYVRAGVPFHPLIFGGSQERGRRAGTENVPGIVGMGEAARWAKQNLDVQRVRLKALRDFFEDRIAREIEDVEWVGKNSERLPNTSQLLIRGIESEPLLIALDQAGICASRGSACMSGAEEPSYVLKAMGFTDCEAMSAIRISMGMQTQKRDVETLIEQLKEQVSRLRNWQKA